MKDQVADQCNQLNLKGVAFNLDQTLTMAEEKNWPLLKRLSHLFGLELERRRRLTGLRRL